MGLDMSMYKYNMKLDEETFKKVHAVMDMAIENETIFVNRFEEIINEEDVVIKSKKLLDFYETYLNDWYLEELKSEPMTKEEFESSSPTKDYEEYLKEWTVNKSEFTEELYERIVNDYETTKKKIDTYKEVEDIINKIEGTQEIAYWRKHSDLNGYMAELYESKGGTGEFNCVPLYLTKEDIEQIIEDHKRHLDEEDEFFIEESRGFFWGSTNQEDWEDSLKDFEKILEETDWDNETVYYSCWW